MKTRILFVKSCSGKYGSFRKGQIVELEKEIAEEFISSKLAISFEECDCDCDGSNNIGDSITGTQITVAKDSGLKIINNQLNTDVATDEEIIAIIADLN